MSGQDVLDFYKMLQKMGALDLLEEVGYNSPTFLTEDKVMDSLMDIVIHNRRVLIYGDYDDDGMSSISCMKDTFDYIEFTNYDIYPYNNRTHRVDSGAVTKAIIGQYDYMIICDSGSSQPEIVQRLSSYGIKTIILDHHQSVYNYENFADCAIINTSFDNKILKEDKFALSAGALVFVICDKLIKRLGKPELQGLCAWGLRSLYADHMDMSNRINRSIYFKATDVLTTRLPKAIQYFMKDNDILTRRFIEYSLSPNMNALFRSGNYDLLNRFMFWDERKGDISKLIGEISEIRSFYRDEVKKATDLIEHKVMKNFVIANLSSVGREVKIGKDILPNYTGLVANNLISKYNKTAVVYADTGSGIKASLRDPLGRDYLTLFRTFCDAAGHNSAFGIHIAYKEYHDFTQYLDMVDKGYSIHTVGNEPIIVTHDFDIPSQELLDKVALYNEFSGNKFPKAMVSRFWSRTPEVKSNAFNKFSYKWGETYLNSSYRISRFSTTLMHPYVGKIGRNLNGRKTYLSVEEMMD